MKVVLVSDIHSRTNRIRDLEPQLRDAGLVLLLGDLTHFGHADEAAAVLGKFEDMHPHVLAVSGNCDYPDVERLLAGRGMSLEGRCLSVDGRCFIGIGGFHVGSAAVRQFIEEHRPLACFSGHIHEARGTDSIGTTLLVNPGSFREGRFATVDLGRIPLSAALRRLS